MARRPRPLGWGIFLQFLLLLVVLVTPLFVAIFATLESGFRGYVYQGDIHKAQVYAPLLESAFERHGRDWTLVGPLLGDPPFAYSDGVRDRIVVLDPQRRVVLDSAHSLTGTIHPPEHVQEALRLESSEGWVTGYLLVGTMIDPALTESHVSFLTAEAWWLLGLFLGSLLVAVPLALGMGRRLANPLGRLVLGVRRAATGDWSWPQLENAPREVQELSSAFQNLRRALQESEARKAQLIADAAHELRTPLTVIRGTLEALLDGVFPLEVSQLQTVYDETLRLERLVATLKDLEVVHQRGPRWDSFDGAEQCRRVLGLFAAVVQGKGQRLEIQIPETLVWAGDPEAWNQIVHNLVSNALIHGRPGGVVSVALFSTEDAVVFEVADDGPGIPEPDRSRIFERLVRLDPSRSTETGGQGLGLAIVRQLVGRQGGSIRVGASSWGGALFEIHMPFTEPG